MDNTFYPVPTLDKNIATRIAHGYNYNQYDNLMLVGKDLINNKLSWAAAAGGLLSTSEDIIKWVQALFTGKNILDNNQKQKMQSLISTSSAKPIQQASETDSQGFGLDIVQSYKKGFGRFWFYEGETLGLRAVYTYVPCNGIIVASVYNNATNSENDHSKDLMQKIYQLILQSNLKLRC